VLEQEGEVFVSPEATAQIGSQGDGNPMGFEFGAVLRPKITRGDHHGPAGLPNGQKGLNPTARQAAPLVVVMKDQQPLRWMLAPGVE
jgi:hypothetical protein